jgi:ubiquinone/menaquinone biosynthesis C-methylase UbiE
MFIANLPIYKKLTRKRSRDFAAHLAKLIPAQSNVLDFGCGNMYTSQELLKISPALNIMGIDVIKDQNLDEKFLSDERLNFTLLKTKELPFPDNHFDVSFALTVMHHTDNPEYYLSELKRVTKPTGSIILIEEMYHNQLDKLVIFSHDWILNILKEGVPIPLNFRSNKHYLNEFERQGLNVVYKDGLRALITGIHLYVYQLKPVAA